MNIKDKIFEAIKGFLIGTALLIPGVSAATIAVVTKIYQKLIDNISNLTKSFWPSFKALILVEIGVLVAIVSMWVPLKLATEHILFAIVCLFAGAVIGSVPNIAKNINIDNAKPHHYLYLLIAILIGVSFGVLSYHSGLDVTKLFDPIDWRLYLIMIPVGFLAAAGIVVPGISGSMLLLVIGFYSPILGLIDVIKEQPGQVIGILCCMAVGVILGIIAFSKLMKILLSKFNQATYIWILGLVIGSIFSLFYNPNMMSYFQNGIDWWEYLLGFILLVGGFVLSYYLILLQRKDTNEG